MKTFLTSLITVPGLVAQLNAQIEPDAGTWKTWFISAGNEYRLPPSPSSKQEIAQVLSVQENLDSGAMQQILYWNAGAPGYRWQKLMDKLWIYDTTYYGALANMLLNVAIYDAMIAAWDTKYAHHVSRPYQTDNRIKVLIPEPNSPSFPCEHSVAAGAASTIIAHFYPSLADSVQRMSQRLMISRIAAGVAYPTDTREGFALGKRIAEQAIEYTKDFTPKTAWDGKLPQQPGLWKGKPMFPLAGQCKTVILDSSSQFRPGPPPDFAKDMEELRVFKPTFRSTANAFRFASMLEEDVLSLKMFEYNVHLNPPRAARMYAISAIGTYDGFISCWDAKYTYWGTRPDQYDTTFHPVLFFTPPFPGYPSGHAMIGAIHAEILSDFFPSDRDYFMKRAKDGAESRFHGGIHFRTDNEVGLDMGKKVGALIVQRVNIDESVIRLR